MGSIGLSLNKGCCSICSLITSTCEDNGLCHRNIAMNIIWPITCDQPVLVKPKRSPSASISHTYGMTQQDLDKFDASKPSNWICLPQARQWRPQQLIMLHTMALHACKVPSQKVPFKRTHSRETIGITIHSRCDSQLLHLAASR
jgi:hypothetical protein